MAPPPTLTAADQSPSEWSSTIPLLLLFSLSLLVLRAFSRKPRRPPSPPRLPFIGNLHQVGPVLHRSLYELSKKHGPFMLLHLGWVPTLVVSSADVAREVLKTQDTVFANRPALMGPELMLRRGDIAFAPYGDYWRNIKKLCVSQFLSPKMVQSYREAREEEVAYMIQRIARAAEASPSSVLNMSDMMNLLLNNLVCRLALGRVIRDGDEGHSFNREMIDDSIVLLGGFHLADFFPGLGWLDVVLGRNAAAAKKSRLWDELLAPIFEEHAERLRSGGDKADFVDIMLTAQMDPKLGFTFTNDTIKAIIFDLFAAGIDTSYITLEWSLAELVRNPRAMRKIQEEVRGKANGRAVITEDDVKELNYLKAVVKETLRMHPAAAMMLPREAVTSCQLNGYEVPAKTRVLINAYAVGRDPKYWEEPEEFRPERFIGRTTDYKGNDFHLIPFGAGRRICPGMTFAVYIVELALANIVNQFDWELPNGITPETMDMDDTPGLTSGKKERLELVAKPHMQV